MDTICTVDSLQTWPPRAQPPGRIMKWPNYSVVLYTLTSNIPWSVICHFWQFVTWSIHHISRLYTIWLSFKATTLSPAYIFGRLHAVWQSYKASDTWSVRNFSSNNSLSHHFQWPLHDSNRQRSSTGQVHGGRIYSIRIISTLGM